MQDMGKTKRRSRWIHSIDRQHIASELKYQSQSTLHNFKFTTLTAAALESGQRDCTGSRPEGKTSTLFSDATGAVLYL